jgi:hypothetical protein
MSRIASTDGGDAEEDESVSCYPAASRPKNFERG